MNGEENRKLIEHSAQLRNEAEELRQAKLKAAERLRWHNARKRIYYTLVGLPVVTTAALTIFLIVDKLWSN